MEILRITRPEQGTTNLPVIPGQTVAFDFDLAGVSFERVADDLVITFGQSQRMTLASFFVVDENGELSMILFMGGMRVPGEDFLRLVESGEDIAVAVEHAATVFSGGIDVYQDGSGDMISGIDRLGALGGIQFQPDSTITADLFPQSPASLAFAASEIGISGGGNRPSQSGQPGQPVGPGVFNGPDLPGDVPAPYTYVKAALLGADMVDNPAVVVNLLGADGTRMSTPYPASVEAHGNASYDVVYDSVTGNLAISLKNPSAGAAPTENITIVADGGSYIVQVGSSATNNLAEVAWISAGEGVAFAEKTWAGSVDNHLRDGSHFVEGQTAGATVVTPDGYNNTELHLQMTNSSLVAQDNAAGAKSASVDLDLKNGSFFISNEGQAVFNAHHADPVKLTSDGMYWNSEQFDTSFTEYDYAVAAAVASKGENAVNTVSVKGGEAIIHAGGSAPDAGNAGAVNIGAVYAAEGGTTTVSADTVSAGASSGGFASNGYATVSGVRADGASVEEIDHGGWFEKNMRKNSEANLEAQGEVSIATAITGDTDSQNHQGIAYAGVAATERGQVNVEAGEGVSISVTNQTGGDSLSTSGAYGIFSGMGFGANDLAPLRSFRKDGVEGAEWSDPNNDGLHEYYFDVYNTTITSGYTMDKRGEWDSETGTYVPKGDQTRVNVESGGNVTVNVDLGSGNYSGDASGIYTVAGDVDITAGGAITVGASHAGTADGAISSMTIGNSRVNLQAQGDVNLTVSGDGTGVSVVGYHPFARTMYDYGLPPSHLSGANVVLRGEAGYGGGADNNITGIDAATSNFKQETFIIHADEKAIIDVTAVHNGGNTSSVGIAVGIVEGYYREHKHSLALGVDAPEFEISATVAGDTSTGNSTATGILVDTGGILGIRSYGSLKETAESFNYVSEENVNTPVDKLTVSVQGARHNEGIKAFTNAREWEDLALADVRASELNVTVAGGVFSGESSNYGFLAKDGSVLDSYTGNKYAKINVETADMTLTVDGAQHSVGISAQGVGAVVTIGSVREGGQDWSLHAAPLNMAVTSTVTNGAEQFRGIALEALDGGHVNILSNQDYDDYRNDIADTLIINGDIVVRNDAYAGDVREIQSAISVETRRGDDSITLDGDIRMDEDCSFTLSMGEGDDTMSFSGGISLHDGAVMTADAGPGDDVIHLNGKISLDSGAFNLLGGAGEDRLVLEAPDAATFNDWYKDWLHHGSTIESLGCETITVSGVSNPDDLAWLTEMVNAHGGITLEFSDANAAEGAGGVPASEAVSFIALESPVFNTDAEDQLYIQLATSNG